MGLTGRVVAVTGAAGAPGQGLAAGLRRAGASVVVLDLPPGVPERDDVAAAVSAAAAHHGRIDALVHAAVPPAALVPIALSDLDDGHWAEVWEGTTRTTLFLLAAAHPHLRDGGGRVVVVAPPVGLAGVAGLAAWATAAEGLRLLAKSTARQWGADGITVNCVLAAAEQFGADPSAVGALSLGAPTLGGPGDAADDLAPVVAWLCDEPSHFVTGATLVVDGGVWTAL